MARPRSSSISSQLTCPRAETSLPKIEENNEITSWVALAIPFLGMSSRNCLAFIFSLVPELINVVFIGHFGSVQELGAVGLGNTMQNCLAMSVAFGLNTAFDTFTSTSGGAGATRLSMVYLARGRIAITLYFFLICPVLWYTNDILLALHQSPKVAHYANDYNRVSLIGLWFVFQWNALQRFLQSRGKTQFITFVQVAVGIFHITWCYLYVVIWGLGNAGLGLANSTSWIVQCVILEIYFRVRHKEFGIEKAQWMYFHWDREAWSGLPEYLVVALPAAFLLWAEWAWWEILAILAGLFGEVQLAAHVSAFNMVGLVFMLPLGLNVTTAHFFGNAIGKGDARMAQRYMWLAITFSPVILVIIALCIYIFARELSLVYTRDAAVLSYLVPIMRVFALSLVPDGMQNVLSSFIRVCERQNVAAVGYSIQNFVLAFGLSLFFGFYLQGGVVGMWWACFCSVVAGCMYFTSIVYNIDLDEEVQRVRARIARDEKQEPLLNH
eukprot:GEMP01011393.1.p1 GENE.GEMP01011393.1~~GEMP01011393.1.p1  ORF type:complete len:496 (+),score=111.21 GEMP01011393.1:448-1935(+)